MKAVLLLGSGVSRLRAPVCEVPCYRRIMEGEFPRGSQWCVPPRRGHVRLTN